MSGTDPLAAIRVRFQTRIAQALDAFAHAEGKHCSAHLRAEAHKLAGVAATLGYSDVGQAAAKVDSLDEVTPDHPAVIVLIDALQQAVAREELK